MSETAPPRSDWPTQAADAVVSYVDRIKSSTTDRAMSLAKAAVFSSFAAIVGADSVVNRKPHPGHYLDAIRMAGGDPARSVMVGDSSNDVLSAKGAGAPVAVYAFGYTDTAPDLLGADAVFTHFTDLPDLLVRLLNA